MWKYIQTIITSKPLELGTWNFDIMFTIPCVSRVTKKDFYFIFFCGKSGGASRSRVCYQRGLPRLVFPYIAGGWNWCFQEARRINIAEYQHIVFKEWLPIIIGNTFMKSYGLFPLSSGFSSDYSDTFDPRWENNSSKYRFFSFSFFLLSSFLQPNWSYSVSWISVQQPFMSSYRKCCNHGDKIIHYLSFGIITQEQTLKKFYVFSLHIKLTSIVFSQD